MPVWHEATQKWRESGELVVLGITQEQHADRCQLFAQWQGIEWPILHDPINVMGIEVVPVFLAIDEHGIVRARRPPLATFEKDFLSMAFADDAAKDDLPAPTPGVLSTAEALEAYVAEARGEMTGAGWRRAGDALALWGGSARVDETIGAYGEAVLLDGGAGTSEFRLGVGYRMRYETTARRAGDFQRAVDAWGRALAANPNQYIWRRRIQQYGPRLIKPYPFYDWAEGAAKEIAERGETPVRLSVVPSGAEIARPARRATWETTAVESPDPAGRIRRDEAGLIASEVVVVPGSIRPGDTARVHVRMAPSDGKSAHWNNEVDPLVVYVEGTDGWEVSDRLLTVAAPAEAESTEVREMEFEVRAPEEATEGTTLSAYALYYVCEEEGGTCLYLRHDLPVRIEVASGGAR